MVEKNMAPHDPIQSQCQALHYTVARLEERTETTCKQVDKNEGDIGILTLAVARIQVKIVLWSCIGALAAGALIKAVGHLY